MDHMELQKAMQEVSLENSSVVKVVEVIFILEQTQISILLRE